jgi:hypothetical protein
MKDNSEFEYDETLAIDGLEPEQKLWAGVLSLALIDAERGDVEAQRWISERGEQFSLVCRGYLGLREEYLCGLMKGKLLRRPKLIFGMQRRGSQHEQKQNGTGTANRAKAAKIVWTYYKREASSG